MRKSETAVVCQGARTLLDSAFLHPSDLFVTLWGDEFSCRLTHDRYRVFKMHLAKGRITKDLLATLSSWRHSGFQVFCGQRIFSQDETAMDNLARHILRASFSQERMQYLTEPS